MANDAPAANATWQKWSDEFDMAKKARGYEQWHTRARKIIKRYRDDRGPGDGAGDGAERDVQGGSRFNILWSNVQTLMPALLAKTPKPVVERRYLDRDDVGRTASVILERALLYELDEGSYKASLQKAVLDRLLPGRGVVWVRYEPKFVPMETKTQEGETGPAPARAEEADGDEGLGDDAADETEVGEEVASESTCVDYVDWKDFATNPARIWKEVWWIRKRVYMTRAELLKRFGEKGRDVPLDWSPSKDMKGTTGGTQDTGTGNGERRAKIFEVWDKTNRKVYWLAESWGDELLDEQDDPLKLEGFWPVPEPLFATLTNDSLVPVPDYYEYQDQAEELDELTNRISWLTKAIKVAGTYDGSIDELKRMFDEGFENKLVPVDNMAEFLAKMGSSGYAGIWLLPIKDMVSALNELYVAREQVKQSLYEITGISDIVRGAAATGGAKTATEQRIKGQFASMRLNAMQAEVARFSRDTLRIMGEIIAEHFDPMTLFLVSGFEQYAKEQWPPEPVTAPQPGQQVMGGNGPPPGPMPGQAPPGLPPGGQAQMPPGPATMPQPMPGSMGAPMLPPPPMDPAIAAQQKAADMFKRAVELLRNDKLRGFRIDIETDSLVEPDQQATQEARTQLLGAISQFLPQAIEAGSAVPELKPLMARLLMFFLRGYKASRDIESAFEQFIDDVTKQAANPNPKPPSPEEVKAKAEIEKAQLGAQQAQMDAQAKQAQMKLDMQMAQEKHRMDLEMMQSEVAIKQQELQMDQQRLAMEERQMQLKAQVDERTTQIKAEAAEHTATLDREGADHQHELGMETMEAKAEAAKKTAANGAAKR